jgi:hypothetical protein
VELYLYPPSGPHRTSNGVTLPVISASGIITRREYPGEVKINSQQNFRINGGVFYASSITIKIPFSGGTLSILAQGLAILTGAFLGVCQPSSCQYHEIILKSAAVI